VWLAGMVRLLPPEDAADSLPPRHIRNCWRMEVYRRLLARADGSDVQEIAGRFVRVRTGIRTSRSNKFENLRGYHRRPR